MRNIARKLWKASGNGVKVVWRMHSIITRFVCLLSEMWWRNRWNDTCECCKRKYGCHFWLMAYVLCLGLFWSPYVTKLISTINWFWKWFMDLWSLCTIWFNSYNVRFYFTIESRDEEIVYMIGYIMNANYFIKKSHL